MSDDNPFSEAQFKTLKYAPRLPWPLPRHHRRDRLLPNVLPLVQHRTSPWRDRDAHPGRRPSQSNPERAGAARADPSSRLDPSSRTLRSRDPTTGSPSPSRLDQPTCDTHNRRNCSVNRNRHCLKVVDRFRNKHWQAFGCRGEVRSARGYLRLYEGGAERLASALRLTPSGTAPFPDDLFEAMGVEAPRMLPVEAPRVFRVKAPDDLPDLATMLPGGRNNALFDCVRFLVLRARQGAQPGRLGRPGGKDREPRQRAISCPSRGRRGQ